MSSLIAPSSVAINSTCRDDQTAPGCDFDNIELKDKTLVIKDKVVDLTRLQDCLQFRKPLGVWYMELDGVTLVDPSFVEPYPTLISRPWLKSLVIWDLKETTPGVLVKFVSLFQHIEELRFEGYSGPKVRLAPAGEDENPGRVQVKKLVVRSYDTSPPPITDTNPEWPGVLIVLQRAVQLNLLETFETDINPCVLKDFLIPCYATLRSLAFSLHQADISLDFGMSSHAPSWVEFNSPRPTGLCNFMQLQHLRIDSVLLPILPPPQDRDEDDVKVAVGCALKTIATILGLHDMYAQKPKHEAEKLRSLEANLVYLPVQIVDVDDGDDDWEDGCGEDDSGEGIKQARLFNAIKEEWKIQAIFNAHSSLKIKLRIPMRDDSVADMLRQRFCDEDSEDRWQTGLEIEAQE